MGAFFPFVIEVKKENAEEVATAWDECVKHWHAVRDAFAKEKGALDEAPLCPMVCPLFGNVRSNLGPSGRCFGENLG